MRLLAILAFSLLPLAAFAHTRADYETAMQKFKTFYNNNNAAGIRNTFSNSWGAQKKTLWPKEQLADIRNSYGKMISFTYLTIDTVSDGNRLALFKVVCEKRTFATAFDLDKENKFGTFRFMTSSPFIDSLLQES